MQDFDHAMKSLLCKMFEAEWKKDKFCDNEEKGGLNNFIYRQKW